LLETRCPSLFLLKPKEPAECSQFRVDPGVRLALAPEAEPKPEPTSPPPTFKPFTRRTSRTTSCAPCSRPAWWSAPLWAGFYNAYSETPRQSFHVTDEGWFGRNTYAGGADKAAHFVDYTIISKELANFYEVMGFSRNTSIALGFGTAFTSGLMNELGDGVNPYGFSWEDGLRPAHRLRQLPVSVHRGRFPIRPEPRQVGRARQRERVRGALTPGSSRNHLQGG
jgi:hypothetical protein